MDALITLNAHLHISSLPAFQRLAVACTSADVLKSLIKEETSRVPPSLPSDRMLRLASHLIGQRCYFPLFPPPLGGCVDLSVAPQALDLPVLPHLLLLPSDLVPFAKVRWIV